MHHTALGCGCGLKSVVIQELSIFSHCPGLWVSKKEKMFLFDLGEVICRLSDQLSVCCMKHTYKSATIWGVCHSAYSACLEKIFSSIYSIKIELFQVCLYLLGTWYSRVSMFTSSTSPSGSAHMVHLQFITQSFFFFFFFGTAEEEAAFKGTTYIFQKLSYWC